jgi:hypothetical protein
MPMASNTAPTFREYSGVIAAAASSVVSVADPLCQPSNGAATSNIECSSSMKQPQYLPDIGRVGCVCRCNMPNGNRPQSHPTNLDRTVSKLMNTPFPNTIASLGELRRLYREPSPLVRSKKMTHLDEVSTRFIAGSPFLLLGTSSLRGPVESHHAADPLAGSKSSELTFSLKKTYEPGACAAGDAWLSDSEKPSSLLDTGYKRI